jgi:methionyl-tRNA synthetase
LRATDPIFPRIDAAQYIGGTTKVEESKPQTETPVAPSAAEEPAKSGPPLETTQAMPPGVAKISIDQFMETDLRVAEIRAAERVPKSKKLIKMSIFTGSEERTIVAGIGTKYTPEELVGRKVVIVANLQPAKLMGIESNGMVLAASIDGEPSLLSVDPSVPAGTKVR